MAILVYDSEQEEVLEIPDTGWSLGVQVDDVGEDLSVVRFAEFSFGTGE